MLGTDPFTDVTLSCIHYRIESHKEFFRTSSDTKDRNKLIWNRNVYSMEVELLMHYNVAFGRIPRTA